MPVLTIREELALYKAEIRRLQSVLDAARSAIAQAERGNVGGAMLNLDRAIRECDRDRRESS